MVLERDDPHTIAASEYGAVRVFAADLDPEGSAAITAHNVQQLLGPNISIDPRKVEVFPAKVIASLGLATYLAEGYGIEESDLKGKRAALDALTDLIVLIPSSAFGGVAQVLDPNPALKFIGIFHEPNSELPAQMSPSASAEGQFTPTDDRSGARNLNHRQGSWIIALGSLIIAAALVLFAVF